MYSSGSVMALPPKPRFSNLLIAALALLVLPWTEAARAQGPRLRGYAIETFGKRPTVPEGPLSKKIKFAIEVAFIESVRKSGWSVDQSAALHTITDSRDPRLVWIIADLMRFVPGTEVNAALTYAAFKLLDAEDVSAKHWGTVTDHLIAWDIPAPPDYLPVNGPSLPG